MKSKVLFSFPVKARAALLRKRPVQPQACAHTRQRVNNVLLPRFCYLSQQRRRHAVEEDDDDESEIIGRGTRRRRDKESAPAAAAAAGGRNKKHAAMAMTTPQKVRCLFFAAAVFDRSFCCFLPFELEQLCARFQDADHFSLFQVGV